MYNKLRVIEKYLSEKLYLQIEKELFREGNQDLSLEYQAPDNLTYSVDYTDVDDNLNVGLKYNWAF